MKLSQITKIAINEAKKAKKKNEVPVGAVVFDNNKIVSKAHNLVITKNNPIGHAEIIVLQKAAKKLMTTNLMNYNLYVTLEPCMICSFIISKFKIGRLYFGTYDSKRGSIQNGKKIFLNFKNIYTPQIYGGIGEEESRKLIQDFFKSMRQ